jgi:hypothetical protein
MKEERRVSASPGSPPRVFCAVGWEWGWGPASIEEG